MPPAWYYEGLPMHIFVEIWQLYLYQPLVNVLVYLYNTAAHQNLGWAVIYFTVMLRVVLLPFSILAERNKVSYQKMQTEIDEAERVHRADPVFLQEYIRGLMKKFKIRPWAKTIELAIQFVVLLVLYQVFVTAIQGVQLSKILYDSVDYPGRLNTIFTSIQYGPTVADALVFDVGKRDVLWAGLVGFILFFDIGFGFRIAKRMPKQSDLTYWILFPIFSFVILWSLPMVKSLFIVTSILFSYVLSLIRVVFWRTAPVAKK